MKNEQGIPFLVSGTLEANPHLYDYVHHLSFSPSGVVEMVDGAGQMLNTLVKGRFSVQARDQRSALVHFSDLVESKQKPRFLLQAKASNQAPADYNGAVLRENPDYQNEETIRTFAPISIKLTSEEGIFVFKQQVVWKIPNEQKWPCLLYKRRYVFEVDPLMQVLSSREGNLYYLLEAEEPNTRFYYHQDDVQHLTTHELSQLGISLP